MDYQHNTNEMKIQNVLLLFGFTLPVVTSTATKHTLYYEYTLQSGFSPDDVFESSAVTVLDGRHIDSYNSRNRTRTPKQDWLRTFPQSYWERGTDELQQYSYWLNDLLHLVIKDFGHTNSDIHFLQWRFGCETDVMFDVLSCVNEYGYDGEDLISYDWTSKQWTISVKQAQNTAEKWNKEYGHDIVYERCVDWIKIYLIYSRFDIGQMGIYAFSKRAASDPGKLTLTCLATGFYPKDVRMSVRKSSIVLPEEVISSSGIRPNDDDDTYQLRKSVDILENEKDDYDCHVTHSSFKGPVIKKWDGKCNNCLELQSAIIWGVFGILVIMAVVVILICVLIMLRIISGRQNNAVSNVTNYNPVPAEPVFRSASLDLHILDATSPSHQPLNAKDTQAEGHAER